MIKKLIILLGILIFLLVVAVVAVGFFIGPIVTKTVNSIGPRVTGTKVELASSDISLLTGGGALKGLFVGNPEGWKSDKAFYLAEIRLKLEPSSLLSDVIVVDEVFIDGPEFVYESNLRSSNIGVLQKQIQENLAKFSGAAEQPAEPAAESGPAKKFMLKSFRLQGGTVTLGLGGAGVTVPMPPVTITDLGVAEGGITADQAVGAIIRAVLANVSQAATEALIQGGGGGAEGIKDATKGLSDGIKGLFGK
ncbi:MAG: hypothetical protein ABII82_09720 [Verrucomicrobiota bacterium]